MTNLTANRTLDATATASGAAITTTTRPETDAVGALATDGGFAAALGTFFNAGNTITIGHRTFDANALQALIGSSSTREGRQTALREMFGEAGMDYDDFRRLVDDIVVANPTATGRNFAISGAEARRVGVIDTTGSRVDYGDSRHNRVRVTESAAPPTDSALIMPPGTARTDLRTGLLNAVRNQALVDRLMAMSDAGSHRTGSAAERAIHDLLGSIDLRNANSVALRYALSAAESGDAAQVRSIQALMNEPNFRSLSDADKHAVLELAAGIGSRGFDAVRVLLHRSTNGSPVLLSRAADGTRLIDTLLTYMNTPDGGPFSAGPNPVNHADVVADILHHVIDAAGSINQSIAGTCTVTSGECLIAHDMPAEYARLVVGLFTNGEVRTADGTTMSADAGAVRGASLSEGSRTEWPDTRDVVERVFQTAMMQMVEPGYNPLSDTSPIRDGRGHITDYLSGLTSAEFATVMGHIFQRPFSVDSGAAGIAYLSHAQSPTSLSLAWTENGSAVSHQLVFRSIDAAGTVTLFNPWGGGEAGTAGYHATPFPHTVVDPAHGIITVTAADLAALNPEVVHP